MNLYRWPKEEGDDVPLILYPFLIVGGLIVVAAVLAASAIGGVVIWGGIGLLTHWAYGWGGGIAAAVAFIGVFIIAGLFADA
jgi:hypothetical protein